MVSIKIAKKMQFFILIIGIGILTLLNVYILRSNRIIPSENIKGIFFLFILYITFFIVNIKIKKRFYFIFSLFTITFISRVFVLLILQPMLISDFEMVFLGAKRLFNGDLGLAINHDSYFYMWPFQLGTTCFIGLLMNLFRTDSLIFIQIISCFIYSFLSIITFLIGEKLFNEKTGRIAGVLSATFYPYILSSTLIYNMKYAFIVYMICIYILIDNAENYIHGKFNCKYIIIGFLIAIASFLKDMNMVFVIAIIIYLVLEFVLNRYKLKGFIIDILSLLFTIKATKMIIAISLILIGISTNLYYDAPAPSWGYLVGSNIKYDGIYNNEDASLLSEAAQNNKYDEFEYKAKRIIKERYKNMEFSEYLGFLNNKIKILWINQDSNIYYAVDKYAEKMYYEDLYGDTLNYLSQIELTLIYIFALISMIFLMKMKITNKQLLIILIFIGFFMGALLVEVQSRYRLVPIGSLIILSSYSIGVIWDYIEKLYISKKFEAVKNKFNRHRYRNSYILLFILLMFFAYNYDSKICIDDILIKNEINTNYYNFEVNGKYIDEKDICWYVTDGDSIYYSTTYQKGNKNIKVKLSKGTYEVIAYVKNGKKVKIIKSNEKINVL